MSDCETKEKMCGRNCRKYLCFSKDLTIATRVVAFTGIAVAVLLMTVLFNDKSVKNFEVSRKVALAFGLDWSHFHYEANTEPHVDPEGKRISIVMIVYAILFFITNALLFLASIWQKSYLTVPWLVYEILSCLSKVSALIIHFVTKDKDFNQVFIIGSIIYLVVIFWFWLVVFTAQSLWRQNPHPSFELSTYKSATTITDSPPPYRPNSLYSII